VSPWSNATGYSYEGTHSLAKAARERCAVQHTVSGPEHPTNTSSPSSVKHDLGIDYVRRAQERIKAQQPIRRPRFQDLVDKQAEELATTISLSTSDSTSCDDSFSFSFDPHFPEELERLTDNTEFGDMMMADCSFRPSSRMWDKGWDDLLKDTETEAPASWIVHAPRAIKPVNAAEMFELLAGGTSS